jgi:hypothetical protein
MSTVVAMVAWTCSAAQSPVVLSVADKAAIIQSAMEIKLEREGPQKFADYVVFSADNMTTDLLPNISGFRFRLMSDRLIQRNARRRLHFRWLRSSGFSNDGDVVLFNLAILERCGGLPCHAHLYKYAFTKTNGEWRGKLVTVIC